MKSELGNDLTPLPMGEPLREVEFWDQQWKEHNTGWDIGCASSAIIAYMDRCITNDVAILIPGCGNAYEAEYLAENGFTNITVLDIAPKAVDMLSSKFAKIGAVRVVCGDFFQHHGQYDLIIEQTFFCAILPSRRMEYVDKAASLLRHAGRVVGLLFDRTFEKEGPPFGGDKEEYQSLFEARFINRRMEKCFNSIPQRAGTELFIIQEKNEQV